MISHALTIVLNELERHMITTYGNTGTTRLASVADAASQPPTGDLRGKVILSVVNIQEERTLKNAPAYLRDDVAKRVVHQNPPVFLNIGVLVAASHTNYADALRALSRSILFFQHRSVFTQDTVDPLSLTAGAPTNDLDRLVEFKLIFNLCSPTLEEVNDMWGMLGGKQLPFVLYSMRMLELRFQATQSEGELVTEVVRVFIHKVPVS